MFLFTYNTTWRGVIAVVALPLFDDHIVTSTDLNRRSGEVLRSAGEHPVTIVRAEGDLVLMQRAIAADLVRAASAWPETIRTMAGLIFRVAGRSEDADWVLALEATDLQALGQEIVGALQGRKPWAETLSEAVAVLHEWRESVRWTHDPAAMAEVCEAEAAYSRGEAVAMTRADAVSTERP